MQHTKTGREERRRRCRRRGSVCYVQWTYFDQGGRGQPSGWHSWGGQSPSAQRDCLDWRGPWTGGRGLGRGHEATIPRPPERPVSPRDSGFCLSPEGEGLQQVQGCLQWAQETEEHTQGALPQGYPG